MNETYTDESETPLKSRSTWMRGLYMLLFIVISYVVGLVLAAVMLLQFLLKLTTGRLNKRLQTLGQRLSTYAYQILHYLTFNRDERPYPFDRWPMGEPKPVKRSSRPAADDGDASFEPPAGAPPDDGNPAG